MLSQYNPINIEHILREVPAHPLIPPATDRTAWEKIRQVLGDETVHTYITQAENAAITPIPLLSATDYLEFQRIGERSGYEKPAWQRRALQTALALGECLEYQGRFLDALMNITWAICEESSWAWPAHQESLADMERPYIDLGATMTGVQMAECMALLGPSLDPMVSKRVRYEINQRLLQPYLQRHDFWWLYESRNHNTNNWNAVCNSNIIAAALYLEDDPVRLARIIAQAARSLDDYLATFDADGGSSEGPGYWDYGFGHYVLAAQLVEQRTNGQLDFMGADIIHKIAQFPLRTMLSPYTWVNFSDADAHIVFVNSLLVYLSQRLDLPGLMALYQHQRSRNVNTRQSNLAWALRDVLWHAIVPAETPALIPVNTHDWYSEMHWMIARHNPADPAALVLAAKGGHNDEMHNQNDVGSFIVHLNDESLIADPGRGRYTRDYFNEKRYEHLVCQSFGHSCPVPNGQIQGPLSQPPHGQPASPAQHGRQYHADLLAHYTNTQADTLKLELKAAYPPAADLDSLVRTLTLHRDESGGWVELIDEVIFASGPGTYESALITFGNVTPGDAAVLITGDNASLHIAYDTQVVRPHIEAIEDVDLAEGLRTLHRIGFRLIEPQQQATVQLSIMPV